MRMTDTNKWEDDRWFQGLPAISKLLYLYLQEKVDPAGFIECSMDKFAVDLTVNTEDVENALKQMLMIDGATYVIVRNGWIWLPRFLVDQRNYPLNRRNGLYQRIVGLINAQELRFRGTPEFDALLEHVKKIAESTAIDSDSTGMKIASRDDLRKAAKDWRAVKQRCMSSMAVGFRMDSALRAAMESWWDHKLSLGNPLEVPMWLQLQSMAIQYSPSVVKSAIEYAIANGLQYLNFSMSKRILNEQAPVSKASLEATSEEPDGWQDVFREIYPRASVPPSFWRLSESRRETIQERIKQ